MERLTLQPERVICGRHGEPFKHRWPSGYWEFAVLALDCLNHQKAFAAMAVEAVEAKGSILTTVPAAVAHYLGGRPICCWLTKEELLEVYGLANKEANAWDRRRCVLCSRHGHGAPYRKTRPRPETAPVHGSTIGMWAHVCLRCVAGVDHG